jgi:hypothetical protein
MVLIAISQQRIIGRYLINKVVGAFRQIDIVYIYRCEEMASLTVTFVPAICPPEVSDNARIFRTFLIVKRGIELRGGLNAALESIGEEGEFKLREIDTHIK